MVLKRKLKCSHPGLDAGMNIIRFMLIDLSAKEQALLLFGSLGQLQLVSSR